MTTNKKLTIASLIALEKHPDTERLRAEIRKAREVARRIRAHVDSYIAPVFARFSFVEERTGKPITKPDDLYLVSDLEDAAVKAYYAACDEAHRAAGYDVPEGVCPALRAETAVTWAEVSLLKHAAQFVGVQFNEAHGEIRTKALELLMNPPRR